MDDFFDLQRNFDLGFLPLNGTTVTRNNFLQEGLFENDVYKFELSETASLNLSLNIIDSSGVATFGFFVDSNNNGQLDASDSNIFTRDVGGSFSFSNSPNFADTYFAAVSYNDGGTDNRIDYQLDLSAQATDGPIIGDPDLNDPIYRFQSNVTPGTYLFVAEEERQNINQNFTSFREEGIAFNAALEANDELIALYRFQSTQRPGTYLFVGEEERNSINADPNLSNSFTEEGIGFYVYGVGAGEETPFFRFQNSDVPGTYLYATGLEADNIRDNFSNFVEEGIAFEARI